MIIPLIILTKCSKAIVIERFQCTMYYFIKMSVVRLWNKECGMMMKYNDDYLIDWLGRCVVI